MDIYSKDSIFKGIVKWIVTSKITFYGIVEWIVCIFQVTNKWIVASKLAFFKGIVK